MGLLAIVEELKRDEDWFAEPDLGPLLECIATP
jgi:hypothetical protein